MPDQMTACKSNESAKPVPLYCRTGSGLSLWDTLAHCREILQPTEQHRTVALLYAPDRCRFATFADGQLLDEKDAALSEQALRNIFEARVFNCAAELRWLHTGDQKGDTALLSEQELTSNYQLKLPNDASFVALQTLLQIYLLWGEGIEQKNTGLTDGWSRLTAARIGKLNVPRTGVNEKDRVQLITLEYLAEYDERGNVVQYDERGNAFVNGGQVKEEEMKYLHGNVAVVEERLLCLKEAE